MSNAALRDFRFNAFKSPGLNPKSEKGAVVVNSGAANFLR
jgi:hypothetical protein